MESGGGEVEVEGEGAGVELLVSVDGAMVVGSGSSVVSLGEEQSGSSMSIRPSPSLSIPSEHCGGAGVVAVDGAIGLSVEGVWVEEPEAGLSELPEPPRPGSRDSVTEA